jgi:hypothetical protein
MAAPADAGEPGVRSCDFRLARGEAPTTCVTRRPAVEPARGRRVVEDLPRRPSAALHEVGVRTQEESSRSSRSSASGSDPHRASSASPVSGSCRLFRPVPFRFPAPVPGGFFKPPFRIRICGDRYTTPPTPLVTIGVTKRVLLRSSRRSRAAALRSILAHPAARVRVSRTALSELSNGRISPICFARMPRKIRSTVVSSSLSRIGAASAGFMAA